MRTKARVLVLGLLVVCGAAPVAQDVPGHVASFWRDGDPGERLEIRGRVMTPDFFACNRIWRASHTVWVSGF